MVFDIDMLRAHYKSLSQKINEARNTLGRPMALAEKILYGHLHAESPLKKYNRGVDYVFFSPDRVAMQDATAQMALLQFMMAGRDKVAVPSTVHCDHLIQAKTGADTDLKVALDINSEVYDFLASVSNKYGIGFWKPGAGSLSFYCEEDKFVIVGDVLFDGSIGRTDLPGGDYDTLISSIMKRLLPIGDDVIVYSGHGPSTTIGRERRMNPFLTGMIQL